MITAPSYLIDLGYSIVPAGDDKRPIGTWKRYQQTIATKHDLDTMFPAPAVATVCGAISGNLEVLDFDLKNDITGTLFEDFVQMVMDVDPSWMQSLVIAQSKSGGRHIYYKSSTIQGNQKLASRPATPEEAKANPDLKIYGLIETRGEGGIVLCSPSPGYTWLQGDLSTVNVIRPEVRDELINIARSFNSHISPPTEPRKPAESSSYSVTPWADYNQRGDVLALLQAHGYTILGQQGENVRLRRPGKDKGVSGDFNVSKRWFTLFTTSTEFDSQKAYLPSAVLCKLECQDNWQVLYERLTRDGFGVKTASSPQSTEPKENPTILKWWYITMDKKGNPIAEIDRLKLSTFLKELGYFLYYHDPEVPTWDIVKVHNKMVSYASDTDMIHDLKKYIHSLPEWFDSISRSDLERTLSNRLNLVHEPRNIKFNLERLHDQDLEFLKDTKDTCFLPYLNGIVCITAKSVDLQPYSSVNKLIWRKSVIRRNFTHNGPESCDYSKFIEHISKDLDPAIGAKRMLAACSIIGYLIHGYKNRIRPKAIILTEQCDDPTKGGGTGKGLLLQGIAAMVKVAIKTGKSFDPNSTFAFQDITPYTRVLNISDPGRKFRIEDYNNIITDAIKTERKNKDAVTLLYEESPKVVIDMNYSITEMEESAQRRIEIFEVSDHFGRHHTPADEFGHALFLDWPKDEYNRFDNFMVSCIQLHLKDGFIPVPISQGGKLKTIKQRWGEAFSEWFQDWISGEKAKVPTRFTELYSDFNENYYNEVRPFTKDSFAKALSFGCKLYGESLREKRLPDPKRPRVYWIGAEVPELVEELPF